MKQFLSENGGAVAVAAVALAIVAGYLEWRIDVAVDGQISAAGLIPPAKIEAMEKDITEVRERHNTDATRMDSKIERIVDILLEE